MSNIATLTSACADLRGIVDKLEQHLITIHGGQHVTEEHFLIVPTCENCAVLADEHALQLNRVTTIFAQIQRRDHLLPD